LNRLWVKLTAAFLVVSLAAIGLVGAISLRATEGEFRQYVVAAGMGNQTVAAEALTQYYAGQGSWEGVGNVLAQLGPGAGGLGMGMMMGRSGMGSNLAVADTRGRVLASRTGELAGETLPKSVLDQGTPLVVGGQQVGTLLNIHAADVVLDPQGEAFLARVRTSLLWAGLGAVLLSLLLGVLLSRLLTAPLARLGAAAQSVAAGDLSQRVAVTAGDEIGDLGRAFNDMAESLGKAETLRKNLIADISHELRTPLTVVQGDLQAILDGVYPLDMAQVTSLYDETRLLTRLVDDLHDLALADAGQLRLERTPVDLAELARSAAGPFMPVAEAAGVRLAVETGGDAVVDGDPDRLSQVLRNLMSNAVRHTPAGGRVTIRVRSSDGTAVLEVADTGTGISAEDLPYVFDRFYRGDRSRSRTGGGAGLGLAIARQLIAAHGGSIGVASEAGGGTTFTVRLPKTHPKHA
jgi:two-component system OmpR family sensor kinase/two-component system sensor histidine kinase BaeS